MALSVACIGVASHLLLLPSLCPLASHLSSSLHDISLGLLIFSILQLPSSLVLVATHLLVGYLARPAHVRLHLLLTTLLSVCCLVTLVLLGIVFRDSHPGPSTPPSLCLPEAQAASWFPILLPLLAAALLAHLLTILLLSTTGLVPLKPCDMHPRVRLHSSRSQDRGHPSLPSMSLSRPPCSPLPASLSLSPAWLTPTTVEQSTFPSLVLHCGGTHGL